MTEVVLVVAIAWCVLAFALAATWVALVLWHDRRRARRCPICGADKRHPHRPRCWLS